MNIQVTTGRQPVPPVPQDPKRYTISAVGEAALHRVALHNMAKDAGFEIDHHGNWHRVTREGARETQPTFTKETAPITEQAILDHIKDTQREDGPHPSQQHELAAVEIRRAWPYAPVDVLTIRVSEYTI